MYKLTMCNQKHNNFVPESIIPRRTRRVAPFLNAGVAPLAEGVENCAVLSEQCISHYAEALCCVGGGVVEALRTLTIRARASSVDEVVAVYGVGNAAFAAVCPVGGNVAVVVFEIVDAPFGPGCGIDALVADGRRVPAQVNCVQHFSLIVQLYPAQV
jgi:hypothetical protein